MSVAWFFQHSVELSFVWFALLLAAPAWGTGVSAEAKDALKRDKYGLTGTGACRFVPLSHETYGRAGPPAFTLLHELAELAVSTGAVS